MFTVLVQLIVFTVFYSEVGSNVVPVPVVRQH